MTEYDSFRGAAIAAFVELNTRQCALAIVIPAAEKKWRILHSLNKAAIKSPYQLAWISMWEQISKRNSEERKDFLWTRLKQLVEEQHSLALLALHDLEFASDDIIRSNKGIGRPSDKEQYVSDHTGYGEGGENFEHENTGAVMNYSGMHDEAYNALKDNRDWQEGYDY